MNSAGAMESEARDVSDEQSDTCDDFQFEVIPSSVWDGKLSLLSSHYFIVTQPDAGYDLQKWPPLARVLLFLMLRLKPEPLYNPDEIPSTIEDLNLDELEQLIDDSSELDIEYHEEEICEIIGRVLSRRPFPKLEKLMLREEKQCRSVLYSLTAGHIPNLSSLTLLDLCMGAEEIDLLVKAIDLGHLSKLTNLVIDDNGFGNEIFCALGRAAERGDFQNLEVLRLTQAWRSWTWLAGEYGSLYETEEVAAPQAPQAVEAKVEDVDKGKGEAEELEEGVDPDQETDETARLPGCEEDSILPSIEQLKRDVGDEGAKAIAKGLKAGKLDLLKALDLCILSDTITAIGVSALSTVFEEGHVGVLNTLQLVHTKPSTSISKKGAEAVARTLTAGHVTHLEELMLGGFESGAAITSALESCPFPALKTLRLVDTNLRADEGLSIGRAIMKNHLPSLSILDLKDSVLGVEGLTGLTAGFESGNAAGLYILHLLLRSDDEVIAVAKALAGNHLPNLDTLEVQGLICTFGSKGAQALVEAYRENSALHAKLEMSWPMGKPWYKAWSEIWENNYYAWRGIDRSRITHCCIRKPRDEGECGVSCHASDCEGEKNEDDLASECATTVDQTAFEIDANEIVATNFVPDKDGASSANGTAAQKK